MAVILLPQLVYALNFNVFQSNEFQPDTVSADTVAVPDSLITGSLAVRTSENAPDSKVEYKCVDSIRLDLPKRKVFLYGDAEIYYEDISLKADYIEIDFNTNELFASGMEDSTGHMAGFPVFSEGNQTFKSETLRYNFTSKKGMIDGVLTEDSYGFLKGNKVKKLENNELNIKGGYYTTCDHDPPHYGFHYQKSRVVPGKRVVTGPAYLVIEGQPTPLALPFGWFPVETGRRNGIILPTYGESANRGFYFENGGYYFAIGDKLDVRLVGDIYTRGSWAVKPTIRYRKRYKFNGNINFSYAINQLGVPETPDFEKNRDFSIRWSHKQDASARPRSTFSADVNIKSSSFNRFNPTSTEDYLSNTFRSSIAYQTNFAGKYYLTINAGHEQNTLTKIINVTLPEVSFSVNRFYPLRKQNRVGGPKWWDNISVSYKMNAANKLSNPDSLFFSTETIDMAQNGIRHSIPVSSTVNVLKFVSWTNSIDITDRMYFKQYEKYWSSDTLFTGTDTIVGYEVTDTLQGFYNLFDFRVSSSMSTRLYGVLQFGKKFPVRAIRHVFTPSISFSYVPDFGAENWGYYGSYIDGEGQQVDYNKYQGSLYGTPPGRNSGSIGFSFANNLEMKVRSRKDTITGTRKIKLIDRFTISGSYDLAKDSLNLSPITFSGTTTLFKNLSIQYRSVWDPYILDSTGTKNLNKFEWEVNRRLLRINNTSWNLSLNWRISSRDFGKNKDKEDQEYESDIGTEAELEEINMSPEEYIDWNIPWDLSIRYSFNYNVRSRYPNYVREREEKIVQTLGVSGNVSITPKWKIAVTTGWDFESNDLSYTSISIYRDLHCWEMRFNWIPTGFRKSWNFSINAKASILQDLKLTKKKDFRDF
jgi:lipopolysaccharide assembly outer membrane protein LptD (OstA)